MSIERLAGCVITDEENQVLLLHRTDHNQWQLPGGRIRTDEHDWLAEDPRETITREVGQELGLRIEPSHLRKLGGAVFRQGIVDYSCEWFQAGEFAGQPLLQEPETYDDWRYCNLFKYGIGRIGLSPNVERLKTELQNGGIRL